MWYNRNIIMKEAVLAASVSSRVGIVDRTIFLCALLSVCSIGVLFPVFSVEAKSSSVIRVGETIDLDDEQVVGGDYYGVASDVALSGAIAGDAYLIGAQTTLNGRVASDTLAIGANVTVDGEVGDDLRVVGAQVTVSGHVRGDLVVVASQLKVLSTAQIDGDLIFFGGTVDVAGSVAHNVMGNMTALRLDGPVGGDVTVTVGALTLGDKAVVTGAVQYASASELVRSPDSVVSGSIVKNESEDDGSSNSLSTIEEIILTILPLLFGALCWWLMFRQNLLAVVERSATLPVRAILIGAAVAVVMPIVAGILLVSGLGILLGVLLMALYVVLLCVACVALGPIVGAVIHSWLVPQRPFGVFSILGGVVVLGLLIALPFGSLLLLGGVVLSLGVVTERLYIALR